MQGPTIPIEDATARANSFLDLIKDCCRRFEICGEVRRRCLSVSKVSIVVEPKFGGSDETLFDQSDLLEQRIERLVADPDSKVEISEGSRLRWGKREKRFDYFCTPKRPLEILLSIVSPPAQFGAMVVYRTGPTDFVQQLTSDAFGYRAGAMLKRHEFRAGRLLANDADVYTPDERSFFEALELPFIPIGDRNCDNLSNLVRKRSLRLMNEKRKAKR